VTSATWSSWNDSLAAEQPAAQHCTAAAPQQQQQQQQHVAAADSCCCDMQADHSQQQQQQQLQRANSAPELQQLPVAGQAYSSWHTTGQQWVQTHGGLWLV
jgi:hypothetical protein